MGAKRDSTCALRPASYKLALTATRRAVLACTPALNGMHGRGRSSSSALRPGRTEITAICTFNIFAEHWVDWHWRLFRPPTLGPPKTLAAGPARRPRGGGGGARWSHRSLGESCERYKTRQTATATLVWKAWQTVRRPAAWGCPAAGRAAQRCHPPGERRAQPGVTLRRRLRGVHSRSVPLVLRPAPVISC